MGERTILRIYLDSNGKMQMQSFLKGIYNTWESTLLAVGALETLKKELLEGLNKEDMPEDKSDNIKKLLDS